MKNNYVIPVEIESDEEEKKIEKEKKDKIKKAIIAV